VQATRNIPDGRGPLKSYDCFGWKLQAHDYQSPFRLWAVSQKSSFQSVTFAFMPPTRFINAAK
jgi:hypothetical protein